LTRPRLLRFGVWRWKRRRKGKKGKGKKRDAKGETKKRDAPGGRHDAFLSCGLSERKAGFLVIAGSVIILGIVCLLSF
jgi:hypothetical protein